MRNLKRALSMLLSSTMVLGMVVMGGSAAGYQDVDDSYNKEAIEVLQAAGIMTGDENGNFAPETTVTRNQMAVIMANLMAYNVATYAGTSPFTDVPEWAEPYVAACWTNGITAGIGENLYGGDQEVTTSQAALMIMKALGYFQYQVDFGDDWQLATVKQANKIDLFNDVDSGVKEAMTRNDVAQLVLNGLEAGMVEPDDNTIIVDNGDTTVTVGSVNYEYISSGLDYADAIDAGLTVGSGASGSTGDVGNGSIVQLGEKLYQGDLTRARDVDAFNRPATVWSYKNNEIGTYVDEATQTWTGKVSQKDLYNAAGTSAVNGYTWYISRNGDDAERFIPDTDTAIDLDRNNTDRWGNTGNGVLTEMFVDTLIKEVHVTIIDTYVAEVTKVEEGNDGYVVTVSFKNGGMTAVSREINTDTEFTKEDIVLVTVAGNSTIESIQKAETVSGTVTAVKNNDYVKLDGETYNYNYLYTLEASNDENGNPAGCGQGLLELDNANVNSNPDVGNELTVYLDAYGNAVAMENAAVTAEDYLYIKGTDTAYNSVSVKAVFYDGSESIIEIDELDGLDVTDAEQLEQDVYRFTKSGDKYDLFAANPADDDSYSVTYVDPMKVENGIGLIGEHDANNNYTGNDQFKVDKDTVFVDAYNNTAYVGYENVPSMIGAKTWVVKEKNSEVASVVYIVNDVDYEVSNDSFFFVDGTTYELEETSDNKKLYHYHAYVNGEETTVTASSNMGNVITEIGMYRIKNVDGDGYATKIEKVAVLSDFFTRDGEHYNITAYATVAKNGVLHVSEASEVVNDFTGDTFTYNDDTLFVTVDMNKNDITVVSDVNVGTVGDIEIRDNTTEQATPVYVLNVDDKYDIAPLATLVLVIVPNHTTMCVDAPAGATTVADLNKLLQDNTEVTVTGDFNASTKADKTTRIVVPEGKTLTVTGTLTLDPVGGLDVCGTLNAGKLVLNGATADSSNGKGVVNLDDEVVLGSTIGAGLTINAPKATIVNNVTVDGKLNIEGNVTTAADAVDNTITVSNTATVTVKGDATADVNTSGVITIAGDLTGNVVATGADAEVKVVTVNGDVTANENASVEVTEAVNGTVYGDGTGTITVAGEPEKPTKPTEITSVDATLPTSISAGALPGADAITVTTTGVVVDTAVWTNADGETVTEAVEGETYTLTVTFKTTAPEYILADAAKTVTKGYTVAATTPAPETTITSVEIKGDKAPYTITVNYASKKPDRTDSAVKETMINKINEALADKQIKMTVDDILPNDNAVDAKGETIGTVTYAGTFKIFLDGKDTGVTVAGDDATGVAVKAEGNFVEAGTVGTTSSGLYASTRGEITVKGKGVTEDIYLVSAYKLVVNDTVAKVSYKLTADGEETELAASYDDDMYFPDGAIFTVTGKDTEHKTRTLVVGSVNVEPTTAETGKAATYNFTFDAATMQDADKKGVFTVKEVASTTLTLKIGDKTVSTTEDVSNEKGFKVPYKDADLVPGEYILLAVNDTTGKADFSNTVTVGDLSADDNTYTVDALTVDPGNKAFSTETEDYILVPTAKASVGKKLAYTTSYKYGDTTLTAAKATVNETKELTLPVGGTLKVEPIDDIKGDYRVAMIVGGTDVTYVCDTATQDYSYGYTVVATEDDKGVEFMLVDKQEAEVRPNGDATGDETNYNYSEKYKAIGLAFEASQEESGKYAITLTESTLNTAMGNIKTTDSYNKSDLKKLIGSAKETGGPLVMGLKYTGVTGATTVDVAGYYTDVRTITLSEIEDTSGTSGWTGNCALHYIYVGDVNVAAGEGGAVTLSFDSQADYSKDITLTWKDANGKIVGISELTISYTMKEAAQA